MLNVTFYTKLNCKLCDEAYLMLMQVAFDIPLDIDVIDITHTHNKLGAAYVERIPVITIANNKTDLGWPFTLEDIKAYLAQATV